MGRRLSPRIAYWTSAFEPDMEAIAAEVATLRRRFTSSVAWGLSPRHWALFSRRRGYGLHPRLHLLFRFLTRVLEPVFHINHVFGALGDWFYLEGKRRRPVVMTVAASTAAVSRTLLERVARFVVEFPAARAQLTQLGIEERRLRLVFPPVDTTRFRPGPRPDGPFTVLFASSPPEAAWLAARGLPQILDAAALRPGYRFRLLWRPWGTSALVVARWIAERGLGNVELDIGRQPDMERHYRRAHVTVAPFTETTGRVKPSPNSLLESLACGRPVVVTRHVGVAEVVAEEGAGVVCDVTGTALADALDRLRADWVRYAARARQVAETRFGVERFLSAYDRLYDEVLAESAAA